MDRLRLGGGLDVRKAVGCWIATYVILDRRIATSRDSDRNPNHSATSSDLMAEYLELNCCVLGDACYRSLTVEVSANSTMHGLIEAIKQESTPTFDDDPVDAFEISILQDAVPTDDSDLFGTIKKLNITNKAGPRRRRQLLTYLSVPLNRNNVHILVKVHGRIAFPKMRGYLNLNCYMLGVGGVFPVTIPNHKIVGDLSKAIKEELSHSFQDVAAAAIELRKVRSPVHIDPIATLVTRVGDDFVTLQDLSDLVCNVFPEIPPARDIHIVIAVRVPLGPVHVATTAAGALIKINCWVLSDDPRRVFTVKISPEESVSALKKAIKEEKKQRLDSFDADELDLWKVSISQDGRCAVLGGLQDPGNVNGACILDPMDLLSEIFRDDRHAKHVHVIVQTPDNASVERLAQKFADASLSGTSGEHEEFVNELQKSRDKFLATVRKAPSASVAAKLSNLIATRKTRTEGDDGPHVNLFHEVFARFQAKLCDKSTLIPPEVYLHVTQLFGMSQRFFHEEKDRAEAVEPIIRILMGNDTADQRVKGAAPDGVVITATAGRPTAYRAFVEFKNEVGTGGCDAVAQGIKGYEKFWAAQETNALRASCCCPSFIIAVAGPWMCILGAVLTERTIVDPLTGYIWIGPMKPTTGTEHLESVARLFIALAEGLRSLDEFYQKLEIASEGCPADCFFPDMRSYAGPSGRVPIKYLSRMVPDERNKTIFKGEVSGQTVAVKFTDRYNATAHKLLADANLAPRLLYSGNPNPGLKRPMMVVMEFLDGRTAEETFNITSSGHLSSYSNLSLLKTLHQDVKQAIRVLHESGLVFGDLRAPNIMIVGGRAKLIDFDWCGLDGQATYRGDVNIRDRKERNVEGSINWHKDVERGGVMRKEHDLWMIEQLFHFALEDVTL